MERTLIIYRNYGVLSAEYRNVYTYGNPHATAAAWDTLTVQIPDGWKMYENVFGEPIITAPWGLNYTVNELLAGDKEPEFYAFDKDMKRHHVALKPVNC